MFFLLSIGVAICLITPFVTKAISPQLLNDEFGTCSINLKYWNIINWYYSLTSDIAVTIISDTIKDESFYDITSKLLNQLFSSIFSLMQLTVSSSYNKLYFQLKFTADHSIQLSNVNLDFEETFLRYSETFSWSGQRFQLRPKETHYRMKRHFAIAYYRTIQTYHTEPILGSFVIIDNMKIFENYLVGTPRKPFNSPRRYFIIAVREIEENWKVTGSMLLEKLWKLYGIGNVLLTAPCLDFDVKV